jgi:hypothetical protein
MSEREHGRICVFNPATRGGFIQPDLPGVDAIRFFIHGNAPVRAVKGDRVTYKAKIRKGRGRTVFAFDILPEKKS